MTGPLSSLPYGFATGGRVIPANLRRQLIVLALEAAAAFLGVIPRAPAQGIGSTAVPRVRFEITPFVGVYLPTASIIDQFTLACGCEVSLKQKTNVAVGGRVADWLNDRVAIEASVEYSGSGVRATYGGSVSADTSANIVAGSAQLLIGLPPRLLSASFYVSGGVGLVAHGGGGYAGTNGTTRFGGVLGAGTRFNIGRSLAVRAEAEDYVFSATFTDPTTGTGTNARFQNDLVFSLGLAMVLGRTGGPSVSPFTTGQSIARYARDGWAPLP